VTTASTISAATARVPSKIDLARKLLRSNATLARQLQLIELQQAGTTGDDYPITIALQDLSGLTLCRTFPGSSLPSTAVARQTFIRISPAKQNAPGNGL
jgi:hypothetical protein